MRFEIIDGTPPLDQDVLEAKEAALGFRLPEPYRAFLLTEANGGLVDTEALDGHGVALRTVCGINKPDHYSADLDYILETYEDDIYPGFFPFATNNFGDVICISVRDGDAGTIWIWDHEMGPEVEGDPPLLESMLRIADSFDDFRNGTYPQPDF